MIKGLALIKNYFSYDFLFLSENDFQKDFSLKNFRKFFQKNRVGRVTWLFFAEDNESIEDDYD